MTNLGNTQNRGPNVWPLVESYNNMGRATGGCSNPVQMRHHYPPSSSCNCYPEAEWRDATYVINAKDWYDGACCEYDSWDPDETAHLGLGANHELTHNAADGHHPFDGSGCDFNMMVNYDANGIAVPYWCKNFWRTQAETLSVVRSHGYPYMS
ncbi:MAG TPA: hypothetical protein VM286_06385 [Candidatus Thermoplasmatota archaeon]|nr:hypothetical protein [Candidatus Thermoplasmatota archaeon]